MTIGKRKLTKEQYDALMKMNIVEQEKYVESMLSMDIILGYGYYGIYRIMGGDEPYVEFKMGESCD